MLAPFKHHMIAKKNNLIEIECDVIKISKMLSFERKEKENITITKQKGKINSRHLLFY